VIDDESLSPWEKLQVLAVYCELKRIVAGKRPTHIEDRLLERIASAHVRKRREQYPDRLDHHEADTG
jgi:hypothetical protein